MAKRNWDKIRTQKNADNARFRDVYEDQQLDRSHIGERETMLSRSILAAVVAFLAGGLAWWVVAAIEMTGACDGINKGWYETFYSNDGADSNYQYVTIREVEYLFEEDGITPIYDEEGKQKEEYRHTKYIMNRTTNVLIDIQHKQMPSYTGIEPYVINEEGEWVPSEIDPNADPLAGLLLNDKNEPIKPRIYQKLNAPELTGSAYYIGTIDKHGDVYLSNVLETYIDYNNKYGDADDMLIDNNIHDKRSLANNGFELKGNTYLYYRLNRGEVVDTTNKMIHDRFLDMRPTPIKLIAGLIVGGAVFAILYMVLKKNLDAQNIMTDTADINQYHNDQHIALPEEVQTLYDVFPDVGAHSSVMVSSMISHQMLTNKGLKKVKLAKRAKENILDEDGDVEIYKGDILKDENGEPLYTEVPIIDNEFSEALFDASKVPKDKYARKYYDAPNIPYNPGNENLDKLKNYNTVAEVINKDWEFPIYEPQRPGGVYIVDTAPVNTIKKKVYSVINA